jgi:hypothetical protein
MMVMVNGMREDDDSSVYCQCSLVSLVSVYIF